MTEQHTEIKTEIENGQVCIDLWIQCSDSKGYMGWGALKNESGERVADGVR